MKKIYFFIMSIFIIAPSLRASTMRVLTYNIRYSDWWPIKTSWILRKKNVSDLIVQQSPDLIGLQEAKSDQVRDLSAQFPSNYKWFGVARDDGNTSGEYNPIFYDSQKLTLLESNTFWLSPTPTIPSGPAWDAACRRIATWGKFQDKTTNMIFYFINTHFDHQGNEAKRQEAHIIGEKIQNWYPFPVILTGDFNSSAYSPAHDIISSYGLVDAYNITKTPPTGPTASVLIDEDWRVLDAPGTRIDFIFVKNFSVLSHAVIDKKFSTRYPSDHLPVFSMVKTNSDGNFLFEVSDTHTNHSGFDDALTEPCNNEEIK